MLIDDFIKEEEKMYKNYETEKTSLGIQKRAIERMISREMPSELSALDYSKDAVQTIGGVDTIEMLTEFSEAVNKYAYTKNKCSLVEDILANMSAENRDIIDYLIIKGNTYEEACEKFNIASLSTIYEKKQKALIESAVLHNGSIANAALSLLESLPDDAPKIYRKFTENQPS